MENWKTYDDKYINIDGINTRFWEIGTGNKYLLFIHGLGGAAEEWVFNIPYFEDKYHILAVDLPGQGKSEKPDISYTYEFYVNFINNFIHKLNVNLVTIIGHSTGGLAALLFTFKHFEKVANLVLISPAWTKKYGFLNRLPTIPLIGEILMQPPSSYSLVKKSMKALTYYNFDLPLEIIKRAYEVYNSSGYIKSLLSYLRNYLNIFGLSRMGIKLFNNLEKNINFIEKPVLLFWGKEDKIVPLKYGKYLLNRIKNLKYHEIENCGHNPHWEISEEFNKAVKAFL